MKENTVRKRSLRRLWTSNGAPVACLFLLKTEGNHKLRIRVCHLRKRNRVDRSPVSGRGAPDEINRGG